MKHITIVSTSIQEQSHKRIIKEDHSWHTMGRAHSYPTKLMMTCSTAVCSERAEAKAPHLGLSMEDAVCSGLQPQTGAQAEQVTSCSVMYCTWVHICFRPSGALLRLRAWL